MSESPEYVALCNGLAALHQAIAALGRAADELSSAKEPGFAGEVRSFMTPLGAVADRLFEHGLDVAAQEADAEADEVGR